MKKMNEDFPAKNADCESSVKHLPLDFAAAKFTTDILYKQFPDSTQF
jgi:hypothetical protein